MLCCLWTSTLLQRQEVSIFGFLQKRVDRRNLVGIGLTDEGFAIACVSRDGDAAFTLSHTDYAEYESDTQMSQQLSAWVHAYHLKHKLTNFALAPHQFNFVLTETPEVPDAELVNAMRWKSKELLDMDMAEVVMDCLPIQGQKQRGRQPMAYVVAADKAVLKKYVGMIEETELELRSIDVPAMVQRNIASLLAEDKQGVALLNLNKHSGLLTITRDGSVYLARDLDVGYAHFASAVETTDDEWQVEGMPPATQNTLDAIVLEVQRSIDYYERYFAQPPINALVIAPLPREVPGMVDYIASQLGLPVRELDLNVLLELTQVMPRQQQSQCLQAIGAALRWPIAS